MMRPLPLIEALHAGATLAVEGGLARPVGPRTVWRLAGAGLRHQVSASALLALSAAQWPDRACVIDDDGPTSYSDVYARTGRLAGALRAQGVTRRSRVGVMSRNHVGFVVASFAILWADADLVLVNTDFSGPQLGAVAGDQGLDLLVHDVEFADRVATAGLEGIAVTADRAGSGSIEALEALSLPPPRTGGSHGRLVILTSGTTGAPKGSRRDADLLGALAPVSSLLRGIGLHSGDPVLIAPPVFHGFGLAYLLMSLAFGCPVVLTRRFDAEDMLRRIERDRVTVMFAVPVMLGRLLDVPTDVRTAIDVSALRAVQSGAAPLSPALATRFMDAFGDVLHDVYGSTETGWSTLATPADLRAATGTVGRPLRGVSVRILDTDDRRLPAGEVGGIFISSGMTAPAYTGGGSKRVVDRHVSTGDLGHLDASGRLFVDGREDDMIVSGGENVFPGEVEDLLDSHPDVQEAYVHGVDDEEFGQRLRAVIVLRPGRQLSVTDVRSYVRERLARYKVPRDVEYAKTLERTATGKVKRVR
ncbi:AMP-binding protein [Aeromicrobium sp. A1-2]|uniref:AMP-binding protein n=1 Tax=Aeromicrobium sp. A1-2 TaxID=2107713 RepID=UPI0013C3446B|nr:AMP-binding protein [Aeromicrobium sp. A1-2]